MRGGVVLVVDDDAAIRDALALVLKEEGYAVQTVGNGRQALAWLRSNPGSARLILLDLMMPVMDGRSFLRAREADAAISRVPVVIVTASGECAQVRNSHHVQDCLPKPIPLDRLLRVAAAHQAAA